MSSRSSRLIFALIGLIAVLSLLHALGGAMGAVDNLVHEKARPPFGTRFGTPVVSKMEAGTRKAGLQNGDTVLALNGEPFRGVAQLFAAAGASHPGDHFTITVRRPGSPSGQPAESTRTILVPVVGYGKKPIWAYLLQIVFFVIPFLALLTGFYILLARPTSFAAWLVFFILAYAGAVFFPMQFMPAWLVPEGLLWGSVVQTLMPIALLLFALHFPDRAPFDRRYPWVKWVLILPQLVPFPYDLLTSLGYMYSFRRVAPFVSAHGAINTLEQITGIASIMLFFAVLFYRMRTSTGDARRRLRILYYGATAGLTPVFLLVIVEAVRHTEFGEGVPRPLFLVMVTMLLLLPLSLAYVVVVQRAMELRLLVRQGTKYFFAKQSLAAVRIGLTVWLAWSLTKFSLHPERRRAVDVVWIVGVIGIFAVYRLVLGGRLQQWVDRRFFRDAYSAEQVLSELSDEARTFTEVEPLLTRVTERIGETLHIDRIAVFLRSGERYELQFAMGSGSAALSGGGPPLALLAGSTTIATLDREKRPSVVYRDDPESWLVDATPAERRALNDLSAELLVPLPGRNRLLGVMSLGPKRSEEPYSRTDRQLLQSVASQTGLALENAELLETLTIEIAQRERIASEIEIAREVQERLFPQQYPVLAGVDMAGFCRPAHAVGGDYYDLFVVGGEADGTGGRLALAVGDISGRGISASLLMASLRASLRSLARMGGGTGVPDLAGLMHEVNQLVFEASASNRYATFFFAMLDPVTRVLTYVNAGHNAPVVLRRGEELRLDATGTVIGLLQDAVFEQASLCMQTGDVLIAYTDGISEAMNHADEEWGEERMVQAAAALMGAQGCRWSATGLVECLFREADRFTEGAAQHDDMTVVVCALKASAASA